MNANLKKLTTIFLFIILIAVILFHSILGIGIIMEEFGDEYEIFIKNRFSTQVIFHHNQGMADLDSADVNDENFKLTAQYCEIQSKPHWRCPMDLIAKEKIRRGLANE